MDKPGVELLLRFGSAEVSVPVLTGFDIPAVRQSKLFDEGHIIEVLSQYMAGTIKRVLADDPDLLERLSAELVVLIDSKK